MMRLVISDLERIISKKNTKVVLFMSAFLPIFIYWVVKYQVAHGANAGMNLYNSLNYPVKNVDEFNIILVAIIAPIFFNLKFYLIIFMIHMIILAVISFVSSILKKTLAVFMITEVIIIGAIYFSKAAKDIIFTISSYITGILCGTYSLQSIFIVVLIEVVLFTVSLYIWNKTIGVNV